MNQLFIKISELYPKCNIPEGKNYVSFGLGGAFIYELRIQKDKIRILASNYPKIAEFGRCLKVIREEKIEGKLVNGKEIIFEVGIRNSEKLTLRIEIPYIKSDLDNEQFIKDVIKNLDDFHVALMPLLNEFEEVPIKKLNELMQNHGSENIRVELISKSEKNIIPNKSGSTNIKNEKAIVKDLNYLFADPQAILIALQSIRNYFIGLSGNESGNRTRLEFEKLLSELVLKSILPRVSDDLFRSSHLHAGPNAITTLLLRAMFPAEEIYDKEFERHQDYISSLDRFIDKIIENSDEALQCDIIKMFVQLGNNLVDEESPTGYLTSQDRYFPVFLLISKGNPIDKKLLLTCLSEISEFGIDELLLKSSGKYNALNENEKLALMLYDLILMRENNELEIRNDDKALAKNIMFLISQDSESENLVGGFQDNFAFEIFQFFNVWIQYNEFHKYCLDLWKELQSEWNMLKRQMIISKVKDSFVSETIREKPLFNDYYKVFIESKNLR